MSTHIPVNHHLRGAYRVLAGAIGVYLLAFGIVGAARSAGAPFFERGDAVALGLRTNMAFGLLSIVTGAIILFGVVVGRNIDRLINLWAAGLFMVSGLLMLALSRTGANFLNYDVTAAIVSFVIGGALLTAGLYGRVGPPEEEAAEEAFRHGRPDPVDHPWSRLPPKRPRRNNRFA